MLATLPRFVDPVTVRLPLMLPTLAVTEPKVALPALSMTSIGELCPTERPALTLKRLMVMMNTS